MGTSNGLSARGSSINPALTAVLGLLAGGLLAYAVGNHAAQQQSGETSTAALPQLADRLNSVVEKSEAAQRRRDRSEAFAAASEPACDDPPAIPPDDMKDAIKASTGWGTVVQKAGMLAPELWHAQSHWEDGLHQWLSDRFIGHGDTMPPPVAATDLPPQAHFCIVRVCPAYRMIFVRSSKTGTQSVYSSFGGECHGEPNTKHQGKPACFWLGSKIAEAGPEKLGFENWDQMWANYTIFSVVRNPLDRAGSGYDYVNSRRGSNKLQVRGRGRPVGCEMPSFARFLKQPWILGFQDTLFECVDHRRELRTHDWYHIEPQNQCLFDNRENIVLDYIIRLEHIEEDMPPLIDMINANRAPGVPEMKFKLHSKNRGKLAKQVAQSAEDEAAAEEASKLRHLKKYSDCGPRCFMLAQHYFADDFRLLRFPTLPLNSTA